MKIEKQVCSIEQAKKLKALGVIQNGAYTWIYDPVNWKFSLSVQPPEAIAILRASYPKDPGWDVRESFGWYSAFTVAELGTALAESFTVGSVTYYLQNDKTDDEWQICYSRIDKVYPEALYSTELYKNEAEARAEMLIIMISSFISPIHEVNARLSKS